VALFAGSCARQMLVSITRAQKINRFIWLTLQVSHDRSWRDSCPARGVTDVVVAL